MRTLVGLVVGQLVQTVETGRVGVVIKIDDDGAMAELGLKSGPLRVSLTKRAGSVLVRMRS